MTNDLLCWGPAPTSIVCRNWCSNFSMLGPHPNLHIIVS
ncbi:hypothetical protein AXF06_13340 [Staphylococcus aureus]|nr:hypothetical protein [Staphylococcus aureus]MCL9701804.1 hypothetical protein [Staphylococcus aureus]